MKIELRRLPGVEKLLACPGMQPALACLSREAVTGIVRQVLGDARRNVVQGESCPDLEDIVSSVVTVACGVGTSIRHVINATGVVLHTNLGRAPMSEESIQAMGDASRGYINLEIDLETGKRGSRQVHVESLLCRLSGAEAALVVNNNAAGILLGLTALAKGKEVVVSRGQAVQIGGGVRIPDIMRQSGARLVEVGTTNVTEPADYEDAIGPRTAALLKVHSSNFKIVGFTQQVGVSEMSAIARRAGVLLLDDLGSGCFLDTRICGLAYEPMVQESVTAGSDLVFFSGDKLLGGPQA
ncbi:MAG: L-seryl-tRNA(Sec) selenium transferase, partial [Dehalococcoidia bacterium]|nr:L-seryl-tRNA(Sec) selenium transferase [Dehalococcoidia bacterium]